MKHIQSNRPMSVFFLAVFLFITSFCSSVIDKDVQLYQIEEIRSELSIRFFNLEQELKNEENTIPISEIDFKKASIKHLIEIDETSELYNKVSVDYDEAYFQQFQSFDERKDKKAEHFQLINMLSESISEAESFNSTKDIFNEFFEKIADSSELTLDEKNDLLAVGALYEGAINFLEENTYLFIPVSEYEIFNSSNIKACSWWDRWGKCAAGTIGGAIAGGLSGCAVSAVPTAGFGCPAGAIVGAIGGGLTGAASSCDGCTE